MPPASNRPGSPSKAKPATPKGARPATPKSGGTPKGTPQGTPMGTPKSSFRRGGEGSSAASDAPLPLAMPPAPGDLQKAQSRK